MAQTTAALHKERGEWKMGWEKRAGTKATYFYKARRVDGKVKKFYCGRGLPARVAERAEVRRRAERDSERIALLAERARAEQMETLCVIFAELCILLADSSLLAAGYHRHHRHPWRRWQHAERGQTPGGAA
jgi:hypothetical protein